MSHEIQTTRDEVTVPPKGGNGHPHHPYIWRVTLRDGTILVRGDTYKGKVYLSPKILVLDKIDIAMIELLVGEENSGWKPMRLSLAPGEILEYGMVREQDAAVVIDMDAAGKPVPVLEPDGMHRHIEGKPVYRVKVVGCPRDEYVAVRLGVNYPDGTKRLAWAFPDGAIEAHPGTYEDLVKEGKTFVQRRAKRREELQVEKLKLRAERATDVEVPKPE